ncbi:MAG: DUF4355 domain-containing protein [Clostridium butyricum]|nr:DUF4355 domain-containing protein [Clostridium butyricum]
MLKSELLKQIENLADDAEVNETVLGMDEFANSSKFDFSKATIDDFKSMLNTNEKINGYYQSTLDSKVSKGINTFKEKTLPSLIEEEVKKRSNTNLTPEQLEIKQLKEQMNKLTQEKEYNEKLKTNASKLKEKKLSTELAKYINTDEDITFFETLFNEEVQNAVQSKIKSNPAIPEKSQGTAAVITKEQFNKMNYKQRLDLYNENRDLYNILSGTTEE